MQEKSHNIIWKDKINQQRFASVDIQFCVLCGTGDTLVVTWLYFGDIHTYRFEFRRFPYSACLRLCPKLIELKRQALNKLVNKLEKLMFSSVVSVYSLIKSLLVHFAYPDI